MGLMSLFRREKNPYDERVNERRPDERMVREVINKSDVEDAIRREVEKQIISKDKSGKLLPKKVIPKVEEQEEVETEEVVAEVPEKTIEEQPKEKIYVQQPVCLSTEQMFNVMNEKFDVLTNYISALVEKMNLYLTKK